ncbi:MAG: glycoside hydrolase family protein [Pedosphaera sp.]|nr:glycoside hydrolase family protein [Pedosphaera sp.]
MERFICIHGHFYQPPRENPWLEAVEFQDSASPYHDWNERITAECYAPNATARILDGELLIQKIVNNYSKISFNFGPTLLAWMKEKEPDVHAAIVAADKQSQQNFSGHGSGMAQSYNHMILPLANRRDKYTQVLWGIRDFEHRFGRKPEGMWLAETAACSETLGVMAELGIKFTVLSPYQASRMREIGARGWRDVNGARVDPTRPYLVRLPSGRTISVFFYDGPISQGVAFERLLVSGEKFANRLMGAFSDRRNRDQLVHIATDGETYGHHHHQGEMALAYALQYIENNKLARLTNYGEYLETHPPTYEVQIHEKSAWSCSHGVSRWASNCGCNSGGRPGWNQNWRAPLREALDWLRDQLAQHFETKGNELLKNPWAARDAYINVILDRSPENVEKFFSETAAHELKEGEKVTILKLMELQRHTMLMYTSCGWFFDELSGIETVQVIQYAARAIQLAREIFHEDFEPAFKGHLAKAKSNIPEHCDGAVIYDKFVKPAMIDWKKVVAHYAVSSVFQNYSERTKIFLRSFEEEHREFLSLGKAKLAVGRVKVTYEITHESAVLTYAVIYLGEHNLAGGVHASQAPEAYDRMLNELKEAFHRADFPEVIRLIDHHFEGSNYSLKSLFKDEQKKVLYQILSSTREDLENRYRLITERYEPLMHFLKDLRAALPLALQTAADFILQVELRRAFEAEQINLDHLQALCAEGKARDVSVFDEDLCYSIKNRLEEMMRQFAATPDNLPLLRCLAGLTAIVRSSPLNLNLWRTENIYYEMEQLVLPKFQSAAAQGDEDSQAWVELFLSLGGHFGFAVKQFQT